MKNTVLNLRLSCVSLLFFAFIANAQNPKIDAFKKLESSYLLSKDKEVYGTSYGKHAYHPASWTIAASFATKKPKRVKRDWKKIELPFKKIEQVEFLKFYQKDVPVYFRRSERSDQLVILFSGSNSDFDGGAWVNKSAHYIDEAAKKLGKPVPNILGFDGYFTPQSLAAKPILPPLTTGLLSRDLFVRITQYAAANLPRVKDWAVMGFSGGATISVTFTRAASVAHNILGTPNPLQKLGTVSFSPVLNGRIAMENIDRGADLAINKGGLGEKQGFKNRASWMYFWSPETALKLVENQDNLAWYQALLYNNFVSHVLYDVVEEFPEFKWKWGLQTDSERDELEGNRFSHFFTDYAYKKHQKEFSLEKSFDEHSSFLDTVKDIDSNIYMVFALDDLLLLRHPDDKNSESIDIVKEYADVVNQSQNLRLFLPERGGHLGYLVDSEWFKDITETLLTPKVDSD